MLFRLSFILIIIASFTFDLYAQNIRRVTMSGSATKDGSNWTTEATTLQVALSASTPGDIIWVAKGNYKAHTTDRNVSFVIPQGVSIFGGFEGTETSFTPDDPTTSTINEDRRMRDATDNFVHETILDGNFDDDGDDPGSDDNTKQVVRIMENVKNVVLDGLTITKAFSRSKMVAGFRWV